MCTGVPNRKLIESRFKWCRESGECRWLWSLVCELIASRIDHQIENDQWLCCMLDGELHDAGCIAKGLSSYLIGSFWRASSGVWFQIWTSLNLSKVFLTIHFERTSKAQNVYYIITTENRPKKIFRRDSYRANKSKTLSWREVDRKPRKLSANLIGK